jgi:prophage regulatory protein
MRPAFARPFAPSTERSAAIPPPIEVRPHLRDRLLSFKDLKPEYDIPFGRVQIWRMAKRGQFPKPIQLSPNRSAWRQSDIEKWLAARPEAY